MVVKMTTEPSEHADTLNEALLRYGTWSHVDPYPEVAPSLLSQLEIESYIRRTGLIYPFEEDRLKTASYEGRIGNRVFIYEPRGRRREVTREAFKGGYLKVPANSIVFVESDLTFHLPLYIGLRFNLQILHVHRGLLLGTGPLIDPGFSGKILIPLHNLTSEPHYIHKDEGLIWVEFTKTTYEFLNDVEKKVKFPEHKKDRDSEYWINKASTEKYIGRTVPIETSIPKAIINAKKSEAIAKKTRRFVGTIGILSLLGLFVAGMVFYDTYFRATYDKVDVIEHRVTETVSIQGSRIDEVQHQLEKIKAENAELRRYIDGVKSRDLIDRPGAE
jgi:deoxycytidine triphosphate deaminase